MQECETRCVLSPLEIEWLAYARDVLSDEEHLAACRRIGGSPDHPGVDATDLRWPGYLGKDARAGSCMLVVSNVHRDFASGGVSPQLRDQLVVATRAWRSRELDDDGYLDAVRAVYHAGLSRWRVGVHIRYVARVLGLTLQQVIYTNAARCQFPELPPAIPAASATKVRLQQLCLRRFPIARLARAGQPSLILFTSTSAYDEAVRLGDHSGVPEVCMHQLNGTLARPLLTGASELPAKAPRAVWTQALSLVAS